MAKSKANKPKGSLEVDIFSPTQFVVSVSNYEAGTKANVVLNMDAMEELVEIVRDMHEKRLQAATMEVDSLGALIS